MHSGMVHVTNTVDGVNFWGECVTTLGVPDLRCIDPPGGTPGSSVVRSLNRSP